MKHIYLSLLAILLCATSNAQTPAPIVPGPADTICIGTALTLTDATSGGTWSTSAPGLLTITAGGVITAVAAGIADVTYTTGGGGFATATITILSLPPGGISGSSTVCAGSTVTESAPGGGVWSSATPSVATVGATGIVTGVSVGTTTILYSYTSSCFFTHSLTVAAMPTVLAVTGGGSYCAGGPGVHIGLVASFPGVVYQLFNGSAAVGTPVAGSGAALDFGVITTPGTYTIVATNVATGCSVNMSGTAVVTVAPVPTAYTLTGGGGYCAGGSGAPVGLSSSDLGINYQLFMAGSAMGSPVAGTGSAISFGSMTASGSYTVVATDAASGCTLSSSSSVSITASAAPTAYTVSVTGTGSYCSGGAGVDVTLSGSNAGISYQLYSGGVPVGTAVAGTGMPLDFGPMTTAGTYTVIAMDAVTGCTTTMASGATITITPLTTPAVSISATPGTTVCAGTTTTFNAAATGGGTSPSYVWRVNGLIVPGATTSSYSRIPVSGEIVSVTLTSSDPCATPTTATTGVTMTVDAATVTASSSSACGGVVTLSGSGATTYSWSPTTGLSCPTCSSATLTPSGTITYTVTGTDAAGCTATATVTVTGNTISGGITYSGGSSTDVFKVWLIEYNPADSTVTAEDSTTTCMASGTPYYEFSGEPAGSYMAKAALIGSVAGTSGYIPTYSLSTPHWDSAATVTHTSSADLLDITMVYGTVPAGPGFIGGNVFSGAGRGTSDAPAVGMLIYLKNTAGHIITYTYTDATGAYSFGPLANGTYMIYPETYKYYTTSETVTLSPGTEVVSAIDFKQHTSNGTITPTTVAPSGNPVMSASDVVSVYPNPAVNTLSIEWGNQPTSNADVAITDIAGRIVYSANVDLNTASGLSNIDISALQNGLYLISVKSGSINYNGKIAVQK